MSRPAGCDAKDELRSRLKATRPEIGHGAIADGVAALIDGLDGWVVTFRALGHEPDLLGLESRAGLGPFALTRTPDHDALLTVHPADAPSERHRYGFDQPRIDAPRVASEEIAAVIVPGLAFDRAGGRLGHGQGWYDRWLSTLAPSVLRIGVVTAERLVDHVPTEDHDIAMTHVVTEVDRIVVG